MSNLERLTEYNPPSTTPGFEEYESAINDSLLSLPTQKIVEIGRSNCGNNDYISLTQCKFKWINSPQGSVRISDGGERPSSNGTYIWALRVGQEGSKYVWEQVRDRGVLFFNSICLCLGRNNINPNGYVLNLKVPSAPQQAFQFQSQPSSLVKSGDLLLSPWVIELRRQIENSPVVTIKTNNRKEAVALLTVPPSSMEDLYKIHVGSRYQNADKMALYQGYFYRVEITCDNKKAIYSVFVAKGGSTSVIRNDNKLDEISTGTARVIQPGETLLFGQDNNRDKTWF